MSLNKGTANRSDVEEEEKKEGAVKEKQRKDKKVRKRILARKHVVSTEGSIITWALLFHSPQLVASV